MLIDFLFFWEKMENSRKFLTKLLKSITKFLKFSQKIEKSQKILENSWKIRLKSSFFHTTDLWKRFNFRSMNKINPSSSNFNTNFIHLIKFTWKNNKNPSKLNFCWTHEQNWVLKSLNIYIYTIIDVWKRKLQ